MEIFVPELTVTPVLLGGSDLSELNVTTRVISDHPDEPSRERWLLGGLHRERTQDHPARVTITIDAQPNEDPRIWWTPSGLTSIGLTTARSDAATPSGRAGAPAKTHTTDR